MLKLITVREIKESVKEGYTVWVATRYPGKLQDLIDNKTVFLKQDLSPSKELLKVIEKLKETGSWNQESFQEYFVPSFIKETLQSPLKDVLNEAFVYSKNNKLAIACFCEDKNMCHTSVIEGLLQAVGSETDGTNYSSYWLIYRMMKIGTYKEVIPPYKKFIKNEPIKQTVEQNKLF